MNIKRKLGIATSAALLISGSMVATAPTANASGFVCGGTPFLCANDTDVFPNWWGDFKDTNYFWGDYGWNDRGDWFENHGASCKVNIYEHIGYGGTYYTLDRGQNMRWGDVVSSNKWHSCV